MWLKANAFVLINTNQSIRVFESQDAFVLNDDCATNKAKKGVSWVEK